MSKEVQDIADQVMANKPCTDAKDNLKNIASDATKEIKDGLQKAVDTACSLKSGADQERIRDTKKRQN